MGYLANLEALRGKEPVRKLTEKEINRALYKKRPGSGNMVVLKKEEPHSIAPSSLECDGLKSVLPKEFREQKISKEKKKDKAKYLKTERFYWHDKPIKKDRWEI